MVDKFDSGRVYFWFVAVDLTRFEDVPHSFCEDLAQLDTELVVTVDIEQESLDGRSVLV